MIPISESCITENNRQLVYTVAETTNGPSTDPSPGGQVAATNLMASQIAVHGDAVHGDAKLVG